MLAESVAALKIMEDEGTQYLIHDSMSLDGRDKPVHDGLRFEREDAANFASSLRLADLA